MFCIMHGGGKRCKHTDCTVSAVSPTHYEVRASTRAPCVLLVRLLWSVAPPAGERCPHLELGRAPPLNHDPEGEGADACWHSFPFYHLAPCTVISPRLPESAIPHVACALRPCSPTCCSPLPALLACADQVRCVSQLCRKHGGGWRCKAEGCFKGARGIPPEYCIMHGGDRRCNQPQCTKSAASATCAPTHRSIRYRFGTGPKSSNERRLSMESGCGIRGCPPQRTVEQWCTPF
jgi:hypothetical protein